MENKNIDTLNSLDQKLGEESKAVLAAKMSSPMVAIEDSLSSFVQHSFECVKANRIFEKEIQDSLSSRLNEANVEQLIKIYGVVNSGNARETSNLITPFAEASIAASAAKSNDTNQDILLHKDADKDVLQGLTALNQLLAAVTDKANKAVTVAPKEVKEILQIDAEDQQSVESDSEKE